MRKPQQPPNISKIIEADPKAFAEALRDDQFMAFVQDCERRYRSWDRLRFIAYPKKINAELAWTIVKMARMSTYRSLPLWGHGKVNLKFNLSDRIQRELMMVDRELTGRMVTDDGNPLSKGQRERFIISALREEAIASSMLEGAVTTRVDAKRMLRTGRKPKNHGERMVLNNYNAIMFIRDNKNIDLSPEYLLELQSILTRNTLDKEDQVGRFREEHDNVQVVDEQDGETMHTPPPANELVERIDRLCIFANKDESEFIHPVIKACILHFQLGFDHPFCDGNGRAARALFYWYMLRSDYSLFEYLPLSKRIIDGPSKYARAYLLSETDDFDVTYFLGYNAHIIKTARQELKQYIIRKFSQVRQARTIFRSDQRLNHRQREVILQATRQHDRVFTISGQQDTHNVAYATARSDLLKLQHWGYLDQIKVGNRYDFTPGSKIVKDDILKKY